MSGISPFPVSKQPPLILVADDDKTIRVLLRKAMEQEGYRVVEVNDGKQCLDAYETIKPDIVLLDAVMPVMDGFTCCKHLLQIARNKLISALATFDTNSALNNTDMSKIWERTPILMISSLDDEDSVNRAFDAGATDYITKPIHWPSLRQRLRRLLQQAQVYKQLEAANQALQHQAIVDELTGLANRRYFDNYLNTQWINLAQKETPISLILCEIDFFNIYKYKCRDNKGDICLQKVGAAFSRKVQKSQDLVARYADEKFAVILPNTHESGAIHIAEVMQASVRDLQIVHDWSPVNQYVTLSMGATCTIPTWESSPLDLIKAADKSLYQAKVDGRNRYILYS